MGYKAALNALEMASLIGQLRGQLPANNAQAALPVSQLKNPMLSE